LQGTTTLHGILALVVTCLKLFFVRVIKIPFVWFDDVKSRERSQPTRWLVLKTCILINMKRL